MELDLEAGWAYQLLAKFGTSRDLTVEGDCSGLTYLIRNGVPASHVDAIRANYLAELKVARTPAVEDGIRRLMFYLTFRTRRSIARRAMSKMSKAGRGTSSTATIFM